jgi:hypothetical protein
MGKIGRWSQIGAWHRDGLADWPSVLNFDFDFGLSSDWGQLLRSKIE